MSRFSSRWLWPLRPITWSYPRLACIFALGLLLAIQSGPIRPAYAAVENQVAVPALTAQVTDTIGMLTPAQRAALETTLHAYAQRTGSEIGILLIASTAPEAIEQYSIRVADAWKLGRKSVDDGVLLIVARDNPKPLRRLRLEVGRGVQGTLTDAQSNRILQDVIGPHFRQNDYYGGLVAASTALQALLDQERLPAPTATQRVPESGREGLSGLLPILFIMLMGIYFLGSRMRGQGHVLSSNSWGRTAGVILGSEIGGVLGRGANGGGGFAGGSAAGGSFSGGGGGFDGGGASGDW